MNKRWLKLAAVPIALTFIAASCGSDDDSSSSDTASTGTEAAGTAATDGTEAPTGTDAAATGDFGGATVTITGPERDDPSIAAIQDTLQAFGDTVGITVEYSGDADWEANTRTQVEGGNPPTSASSRSPASSQIRPGRLARAARPTTSSQP